MNLTTVGADIERLSHTAKTVADSAALVDEMNKEVRTISYLLHPPLLDEAGLASALSGAGIATEKLDEMASAGTPGVGIRGMRERLRQLGGTLQIDSNGGGTVVDARLPVSISSTAAA
jgi:signal transduction histidine kinase